MIALTKPLFRIVGSLFSAALALHLASPIAAAETPIRLGMSTALTGPSAQLGLQMQAGVEAALSEANQAGGIGGRKLELIALDDGYEPARTGPNMRRLIEEDHVLAVVGNVGTPTAVVAAPICTQHHVLFYGAFTGAGVLRKTPPDRYVINYRASYTEETAAMVDALVNEAHIGVDEIACFTQRDAYGDSGFAGALAALKKHGLASESSVAHGRYERNTTNVEDGLAEVLLARKTPRAVILVGTYAPCAAFISKAKEAGLDAIFLNVSFVGARPLAEALGEKGDGVVMTQVVSDPTGGDPIVQQYRQAIERTDPDRIGVISLEGYLSTRVLLQAVRTAQTPLTRENLVAALESLGDFALQPGVPLRLNAETHQASHGVWPSQLRRGTFQYIPWSELNRRSEK